MPDSPAYLCRKSELFVLVEIIKVERVHEVLENVQAFVGRVDIRWFAVNFLVRGVRGFFHHGFFNKDRHMHAHCQSNGIARTRVDFKLAPVLIQHNFGKEHIAAQFVDDDVYDFRAHLRDCRLEQVMCQGPRDLYFLQFNRNGIGFAGANPDREVTVTCHVLEQHNAVLRHQTDTYTVNSDFNHSDAPYNPFSWGETPLDCELLLSIADSTLQTNVQLARNKRPAAVFGSVLRYNTFFGYEVG